MPPSVPVRCPGQRTPQSTSCATRSACVADALESAGIPTAVYYPRCVHDHPAHTDRVHTPGPLQHAQRYCAESLALPFHAGLSNEDVAHIVATLEAVL